MTLASERLSSTKGTNNTSSFFDENQVHLGFAFASPLLQLIPDNNMANILEQLAFQKEFDYITEAAKDSDKLLKVYKTQATRNSFEKLLD